MDACQPILSKLEFREDQILLSVVAKHTTKDLANWAAPASVCRSLPMMSSQFHAGHTLVCFGNTRWSEVKLSKAQIISLFEKLGTISLAENDEAFGVLGLAG